MSSEINNLLTEKILNSHFFVELLSSKEDIANKSIQSKISTLEFLVELCEKEARDMRNVLGKVIMELDRH